MEMTAIPMSFERLSCCCWGTSSRLHSFNRSLNRGESLLVSSCSAMFASAERDDGDGDGHGDGHGDGDGDRDGVMDGQRDA